MVDCVYYYSEYNYDCRNLINKKEKEKISFVINIFYALLFFGCHLFILLSHYSLSNLIICLCVLSILKLFAIAAVPAQNESYEPVADEKHFLKHWGYLGLNEILGVISKWIDKVFLLYLLTASDFAVFFNGSFEIPLFGLLISVAGSFMLIEFSENIQLKNKIITLFKESLVCCLQLCFRCFFSFSFLGRKFFHLLLKINTTIRCQYLQSAFLSYRYALIITALSCSVFRRAKKLCWVPLSILLLLLF